LWVRFLSGRQIITGLQRCNPLNFGLANAGLRSGPVASNRRNRPVPNNPNPFDLELDGFYTSGI